MVQHQQEYLPNASYDQKGSSTSTWIRSLVFTHMAIMKCVSELCPKVLRFNCGDVLQGGESLIVACRIHAITQSVYSYALHRPCIWCWCEFCPAHGSINYYCIAVIDETLLETAGASRRVRFSISRLLIGNCFQVVENRWINLVSYWLAEVMLNIISILEEWW